MIFKKEEMKDNTFELSKENMLSYDDLIESFGVTSKNEVIYPLGKIKVNELTAEGNDKTEYIIHDLEELRRYKCWIDTIERQRLFAKNSVKYISGNVEFKYPYYGDKLMKEQVFKDKDEEFKKYLLEQNTMFLMVAHENCGYEYRADGDNPVRNYVDFMCDGQKDTELIQKAIDSYPEDFVYIDFLEDEYILKPTSGSGTKDDPYICLNINRDNIILRGNNRKTNFTYDKNIVKEGDYIYLIKSTGNNVVSSNINYCLDELDIFYEEYSFPEPTEKMISVKEYVESIDPEEKMYTKKMVLDLINKEE